MSDTYTAPFEVTRNLNGSYTVTAGNSAHHFDNADQAMAAYAYLVQRIGAEEKKATS